MKPASHSTSPRGLRRRHLLAWTGAVVAVPAAAQADLAEAINLAGRQRMLSQRMVKAWLALAAQTPGAAAAQVLNQSISLFERQHEQLKTYSARGPAQATYGAMEPAWQTLREGLMAPPSPARAAALLQADAQVLALAQQGTRQLEATASRPTAALVNLAGRQRMLSQRLAKFYFAGVLRVDAGQAGAEMARARGEFLQAQQQLRQAPDTSARIAEELTLAEGQWVFFDTALAGLPGASPGARALSEVFVASENLLSVMDRVTGLYAALKT